MLPAEAATRDVPAAPPRGPSGNHEHIARRVIGDAKRDAPERAQVYIAGRMFVLADHHHIRPDALELSEHGAHRFSTHEMSAQSLLRVRGSTQHFVDEMRGGLSRLFDTRMNRPFGNAL